MGIDNGNANNNNNKNNNNKDSSAESEPVSWPGLLLVANNGELQVCKDLLGQRFFGFTKHGSDVLVSCRDGCRLVSPSGECRPYCKESFSSISSGAAFFVGVSPNGKLYSWGVSGDVGQLGQGVSRRESLDPSPIPFNASFASVQCGEAFSIAIDNHGTGYSFGENFSRQLALYTKPQQAMPLKTAVVEDMSFSPRLMPFTLRHPLRKVSCGQHFVLALTRDGAVYSWGAGESGQLGTGRCTSKELPSPVLFPPPPPSPSSSSSNNYSSSMAAVDVACGAGHSLAVLETGAVFAWGLNHRGQLGLGDLQHRPFPTPLLLSDRFEAVIADGHSSAALTASTRALYTWGCSQHGRLLLSSPSDRSSSSITTPSGAVLAPHRVQSSALGGGGGGDGALPAAAFLFTASSCAVLVRATLTHLSPAQGPLRGFSHVSLFGYGLWPSPHILVKFTSRTESMYHPPRSVVGQLVAEAGGGSRVVCKPPRLSAAGDYDVSLSMDGGREFFATSFPLRLYPDPVLVAQSPAVVDLRGKILPPLTLTFLAGRDEVSSVEEVGVKLSLVRVRGEDSESTTAAAAASTKAGGGPLSPSKTPATPSTALWLQRQRDKAAAALCVGDVVTTARVVLLLSQAEGEGGGDRVRVTVVTEEVSLSSLAASCPALRTPQLYDLLCQLSFNGQDYSVGSATAAAAGGGGGGGPVCTLCHEFTAREVLPALYPLTDLLQRGGPGGGEGEEEDQEEEEEAGAGWEKRLVVRGQSLLPAHKLPPDTRLLAVWSALRLLDPASSPPPPVIIEEGRGLEGVDALSVRCEGVDSLQVTLTRRDLSQLVTRHLRPLLLQTAKEKEKAEEDRLVWLQLSFLLEKRGGGEGGGAIQRVMLSPSRGPLLGLLVYPPPVLDVSPKAGRRRDWATAAFSHLTLSPKGREGWTAFRPALAAVKFTFPRQGTGSGIGEEGEREEVEGDSVIVGAPQVAVVSLPSLGDGEDDEEEETPSHDLSASQPTPGEEEGGEHAKKQKKKKARELFIDTEEGQQVPDPVEPTPSSSSSPRGYQLRVTLPPLPRHPEYQTQTQTQTQTQSYPGWVWVSVALDGQTFGPRSQAARLPLFGNLAAYRVASAVPKGGLAAGAAVSLALEEGLGSLPSLGEEGEPLFDVRVRLYGSDPEAGLTLPASLSSSSSSPKPSEGKTTGAVPEAVWTVQFNLPDAGSLGKLGAVVQGKEKWLHVAVSVDGAQSFDYPDKPLLQVK